MLCIVVVVDPCLFSPACQIRVIPVAHIRFRIIEIGWQIPVVVRSRIRGIVPVECGIPVASCPVDGSDIQPEPVIRSPGIFEHRNRFVVVPNPRIAHLSVLISPVGVVIVAADKVIDLLGRSVLCPALYRGTENGKTEPVGVIPVLLCTEIVCKRPVVHTFHPVVASDTGRHIDRE